MTSRDLGGDFWDFFGDVEILAQVKYTWGSDLGFEYTLGENMPKNLKF